MLCVDVNANLVGEQLSHRILRALTLARERTATADLLNFYADLCEFEQTMLPHQSRVLRLPDDRAFAEALDARAAASLVPAFVTWLDTRPQQGLANITSTLLTRTAREWEPVLERYWRAAGVSLTGVEEVEQFVAEAFLQPFAECVARVGQRSRELGSDGEGDATKPQAGKKCRVCKGDAFVATLRDRGDDARRSLVCGFCLSEWDVPRATCVECGENGDDALLVYRAEEFPDIRIDACGSCGTYIKTIDLTVNAAAIAVVDDLASVAMDLWAAGRGYRKLRPNLLRL
jgi:formate dehydrogenase maturation protein FdhE